MLEEEEKNKEKKGERDEGNNVLEHSNVRDNEVKQKNKINNKVNVRTVQTKIQNGQL